VTGGRRIDLMNADPSKRMTATASLTLFEVAA
jgi:hypothetical protein